MVTLITSQIPKSSPDITHLLAFEEYCKKQSSWTIKRGPKLFNPRSFSLRFYSGIQTLLKPILKQVKVKGAVVSLGLPYYHYLTAKTFPYYGTNCDLRVLWTYDVWEPDFERVAELVSKSKIELLLLSSYQATQHFKQLNLSNCKVHWVPETIDVNAYQHKEWKDRSIHILSFGRSWLQYHDLIVKGCQEHHINYQYQERSASHDVAVHGLKRKLQFPTTEDFTAGLADSQICICFPRCVTHPALAGEVSTLTIRYLQAMASKCVILGSAPKEITQLFDYNPVVEIDWENPVEQIRHILDYPEEYLAIVEKNYQMVHQHFHHQHAIDQINVLIKEQLT